MHKKEVQALGTLAEKDGLGSRSWLIAERNSAPPACLKYVVELLAGGVSHRCSF